jgi:hypothetical protein
MDHKHCESADKQANRQTYRKGSSNRQESAGRARPQNDAHTLPLYLRAMFGNVLCCSVLQVERARKMARTDGGAADNDEAPLNTELQRSEADEPIKLSLAASSAAAAAAAAAGDGKAAAAAARSKPAPLFGDDDGEWCFLAVGLSLVHSCN